MPQKSDIRLNKELEINKILITINDFFKIMEVVVVSIKKLFSASSTLVFKRYAKDN